MTRIKEIEFKKHKILGDLTINFCDPNGDPLDTIIIAGENGTGKSTILNAIYNFAIGKVDFEGQITLDTPTGEARLIYERGNDGKIIIRDQNGQRIYTNIEPYKSLYILPAIYSDVDINFTPKAINSVTSLDLDTNNQSKHSDANLPTKIKQLLIDIQSQDAMELFTAFYNLKEDGSSIENLNVEPKIFRFTNAFNKMFENLYYADVENINSQKEVIFKKYGVPVRIDDLSSGEKQIVFRGCFLLQDLNALKGALVFIDEPEISLHPRWQVKILDFYKGLFTDTQGVQTSQIFLATHSPFIIFNENRVNDKVIVLERNSEGEIIVQDKPEYYKCNSIEAVQDAFYIKNFSSEKSTVYLEGRTDEKYFNKALEVYGYTNLPFEFKWIGYMDEKNQEVNTGSTALNKAFQFLVSKNLPIKNFCLKDCDTNQEIIIKNNVISLSIPYYDNPIMKKGIENAIVFGEFDFKPYYKDHIEIGAYGENKNNPSFDKMACCEAIIDLPNEALEGMFIHLKEQIDVILQYFEDV